MRIARNSVSFIKFMADFAPLLIDRNNYEYRTKQSGNPHLYP